jgi:hypothetical protein
MQVAVMHVYYGLIHLENECASLMLQLAETSKSAKIVELYLD